MTNDYKNKVTDLPTQLDLFRTYIDGKMNRYSLLFAVNGGAFAIAKLIIEKTEENIIGGLTTSALAIGACIFSFLMGLDIWFFGQGIRKMAKKSFHSESPVRSPENFGPVGQIILMMLVVLLIVGRILAAFF